MLTDHLDQIKQLKDFAPLKFRNIDTRAQEKYPLNFICSPQRASLNTHSITSDMYMKTCVQDNISDICTNHDEYRRSYAVSDDNDYMEYLVINGGKTMNNLSNTLMTYIKEKATEFTINNVKNKFGVEHKFIFSSDQYINFLKWLKKYDSNFRNHIIKNNRNFQYKYTLKDVDMIIRIDKNTFCRIVTGKQLLNNLSEVEKYTRGSICVGEVKIYAFGKNCYKVIKELMSIEENDNNDLNCYKVSYSKYDNTRGKEESLRIFLEKLQKRDLNTIFLCEETEHKLFYHIDKFMHNKSIYEKRNLNYKTGILLHGLPGTGKTSIANMICTRYDIDMILINMSEFANINVDELTSSINVEDKSYVILMEDIDCVIGDRESKEDDATYKKNVNKLLQFLDSTSSPSNVIFIATTNHIEKLDKAILRDGRFDLILNIDNIDRPTAIKMCKSFNLHDNIIKDILDLNMKDGKINPATLQNLILQKIENYSN